MSENDYSREIASFLCARDTSVDRCCRPIPQKRMRFAEDIDEDESSLTIDDRNEDGEETNCTDYCVSVFLRLRPIEATSSAYTISSDGNVFIAGPSNEATSTSNNKNAMEKHFSFSEIYDMNVEQKNIYDKCIGRKIAMDESCTILTYGTSGSGKTFTLLGTDEKPGILPRALANIFTLYAANIYPHASLKPINATIQLMDDTAMAKDMDIRERVLRACSDIPNQYTQQQQIICNEHNFETTLIDDTSIFIWISFIEIYNEFVYDLFDLTMQSTRTRRKNLKIVGNDGKVFIKGLTSIYVKSSEEALKLLRLGIDRLTYAATSINSKSSRSHCIFVLNVLKYTRNGLMTETSYKFCDLAGSERLNKSGNVGSRLKEAQRINTSLLVLGRCIEVANSNNRKNNNDIIPFRESKLTMLLQASLLGKEKLTMIVHVTPIEKYYEENLNVLNFASVAKNIIFKAPAIKLNNSRYLSFMNLVNGGKDEALNKLLDENIFLHNEVDRLSVEKDNLEQYYQLEMLKQEKNLRNKLVDSFKVTLDNNKQHFETNSQREMNYLKSVHEREIRLIKQQHEDELDELRDEIEALRERLTAKKRRTTEL